MVPAWNPHFGLCFDRGIQLWQSEDAWSASSVSLQVSSDSVFPLRVYDGEFEVLHVGIHFMNLFQREREIL